MKRVQQAACWQQGQPHFRMMRETGRILVRRQLQLADQERRHKARHLGPDAQLWGLAVLSGPPQIPAKCQKSTAVPPVGFVLR